MPHYNDRIDNFVCGDNLIVKRYCSALPSGVGVAKAWFTVKKTGLDDDPAAISLLEITAVSSTAGVIEDTGSVSGVALVTFKLSPTDTAKYSREYDFEIQLKLDDADGTLNTPIQGKIKGRTGLTRAVA